MSEFDTIYFKYGVFDRKEKYEWLIKNGIKFAIDSYTGTLTILDEEEMTLYMLRWGAK